MQKVMRLLLVGVLSLCAMSSYLQQQSGGMAQQATASLSAQDEQAFRTEYKRLQQLWRMREQRNIVPEIKKFTSHRVPQVQLLAARILGRLEEPTSLKELERIRRSHPENLLLSHASIAIGRIQARNLTGQRKLLRVAQEVGLDWNGVRDLFSRVNRGASSDVPVGNAARETRLVREFMDVLGQSVIKEKKVSPWMLMLPLHAVQRLYLEALTKPPATAAEMMVKHLSQVRIIGGPEMWLRSRLLDMNESVVQQATRNRLTHMIQHSQQYPHPMGYELMLELCEATNDRKAIPLLRRLEHSAGKDIALWASQYRYSIERNIRTFTSDFP